MKTSQNTAEQEIKLITPVCALEDIPSKVQIGIQDGYCNLKCNMCFLHSPNNKEKVKAIRGEMTLIQLETLLEEIKQAGKKPTISPYRWAEPLMTKNLRESLTAIKEREFPIVINTNGVLLGDDVARFLVDIKTESVTVSIDACSNETYRKIRGVDAIEQVEKAVFNLLEARGTSELPRIGVSLTLSHDNEHEKDQFIDYWLQYVDVVRVNKEQSFDTKGVRELGMPGERVPCYQLYDNLTISCSGDAVICCLDALNEFKMGNVFSAGIKNVWLGERFQEIRYYHETGQYDKVPFCKNCNMWMNPTFSESEENGILVRSSPIMTFYNRLDRIGNWLK